MIVPTMDFLVPVDQKTPTQIAADVFCILDVIGPARVKRAMGAFTDVKENQMFWLHCFLGRCVRPWWWRFNTIAAIRTIRARYQALSRDTPGVSGALGTVVWLFDHQPERLHALIESWRFWIFTQGEPV